MRAFSTPPVMKSQGRAGHLRAFALHGSRRVPPVGCRRGDSPAGRRPAATDRSRSGGAGAAIQRRRRGAADLYQSGCCARLPVADFRRAGRPCPAAAARNGRSGRSGGPDQRRARPVRHLRCRSRRQWRQPGPARCDQPLLAGAGWRQSLRRRGGVSRPGALRGCRRRLAARDPGRPLVRHGRQLRCDGQRLRPGTVGLSAGKPAAVSGERQRPGRMGWLRPCMSTVRRRSATCSSTAMAMAGASGAPCWSAPPAFRRKIGGWCLPST